jgi:hypothetical protein
VSSPAIIISQGCKCKALVSNSPLINPSSNSSYTTSPVDGCTAYLSALSQERRHTTIPIFTFSSVPDPPPRSSTIHMIYPVDGAIADNSSSRLKSSIYVPFVYKFVSLLSNGALLLSPTAFNAAVSVWLSELC